MNLCVRCKRSVSREWVCCAHCGVALEGKARFDRRSCEHEFEIVGPHCVLCGLKSGMGANEDSFWFHFLSVAGLFVGIGLVRFGARVGTENASAGTSLMVAGGSIILGAVIWLIRSGGWLQLFRRRGG